MNSVSRRDKWTLAGTAAVATLVVIFAANASRPASAPRLSKAEQLQRGKYLVTIGGCHDCHTPWIVQPNGQPGPDMSRALSGHPQQHPIKEPLDLKSKDF